MSAASIQERIRRGLARAVSKTGSATSEKVYKLVETTVGGNGTPLDTGTVITTSVELVNAVFTEYDIKNISNTEIQAGDRKLVTNTDVEINKSDIIKQGAQEYLVVNVDIKAPTSDVLCYISQVRAQ